MVLFAVKISNACLQDNEQIENKRGEKEGEEDGMEETQVHTFEKCYIGSVPQGARKWIPKK